MSALLAGGLAATALWLLLPRPAPVDPSGRGRGRRVRRAASRRTNRTGAGEEPEVMEHLALALSAGAPVLLAVRAVAAACPDPARAELSRTAAALAWGVDEQVAWREAGARWAPTGRALALAARAGVAPAGLLRAAAADLRRDRLARVEADTAALSVRLVVPLGLLFLPGFVLTTVVPIVLALTGERWLDP